MITIGNAQINGIFIGNSEVKSIWLGNVKIYESETYDYTESGGVITIHNAPYSENEGVITIL